MYSKKQLGSNTESSLIAAFPFPAIDLSDISADLNYAQQQGEHMQNAAPLVHAREKLVYVPLHNAGGIEKTTTLIMTCPNSTRY